jgi:hypothetical protein
MRHQTPLWLQRLKRRKTPFQSPNASGRSRQGEPVTGIARPLLPRLYDERRIAFSSIHIIIDKIIR